MIVQMITMNIYTPKLEEPLAGYVIFRQSRPSNSLQIFFLCTFITQEEKTNLVRKISILVSFIKSFFLLNLLPLAKIAQLLSMIFPFIVHLCLRLLLKGNLAQLAVLFFTKVYLRFNIKNLNKYSEQSYCSFYKKK